MAREELKSVLYASAANLIGLLVSLVAGLIVPKFISDIDYGYWQLYILYTSYAGFMHFGLQDGIYLRLGGKHYVELHKGLLHGQLMALTIFELLLTGIVCVLTGAFCVDLNKRFIIRMFMLCCCIYLPDLLLQCLLLITNRIKDYSTVLTIEKAAYGLFLVALVLLKQSSFQCYIVADIASKLLGLICTCVLCRDIVLAKSAPIKSVVHEVGVNCRVGIVLMLANVASLLITGVTRMLVEAGWDIAAFAQVSLTLSMCNFFLVFLNAVGQVVFPILKRRDPDDLPHIYGSFSFIMTFLGTAIMVFYPVVNIFIKLWLPQYAQSADYLVVLLPMCLYEIKVNVLLMSYYKVLRREKTLLVINMTSALACVLLSLISVMVLHNLWLSVLTITVSCALRCLVMEAHLPRLIGVERWRILLTDIVLPAAFIACYQVLPLWGAMGVYLLCMALVYGLIDCDQIKGLMKIVRKSLKEGVRG